MSKTTIVGLMIALLFVYLVNMHREFDKRMRKLEKKHED